MKKIFMSIMLLALAAVCLSGCGNGARSVDTLNIADSTFVNQITDIQNNPASYIGKTIKLEGIFEADEHEGHAHYYVYRNTAIYDTDHGHEHINKIGLEFEYNGSLPKDDDFIEVVGVLRNSTDHGNTSIVLEATSVIILSERGPETVK